MNILITGAKGFVGRNLSETLKTIRDGKNRTTGLPIGEIYYWNEELDNEESGAVVECPEGMPADTVMEIKLETANVNLTDEQVQLEYGEGRELKAAYSIALLRNGVEVQPSGKLTVRIKLTQAQMKCSELRVAYVTDDRQIIPYDSFVEDGYIVFETDHLSHWAIIGNVLEADLINGADPGSSSVPTNSRVLILSFALLAIASMAFGLVLIAGVRKGRGRFVNSKKN